MTPYQLMRHIVRSCGVPSAVNVDDTINNLRHEFRGRRAMLWLDEAQHLNVGCLEIVRELNDESPHFGLVADLRFSPPLPARNCGTFAFASARASARLTVTEEVEVAMAV